MGWGFFAPPKYGLSENCQKLSVGKLLLKPAKFGDKTTFQFC